MSLLVISEILGLFVNTLITNNMSSLRNRGNLQQSIQMQFPKKEKLCPNFICFISEIYIIF